MDGGAGTLPIDCGDLEWYDIWANGDFFLVSKLYLVNIYASNKVTNQYILRLPALMVELSGGGHVMILPSSFGRGKTRYSRFQN